jgi:LmbE family N-acetylglucosaminyl deacetylase
MRRLAVLSPHLDDAVLSVGATLAEAARAGDEVLVVTVFAGDPRASEPAGEWDRRCGFSTAGEAARRRADEDVRACGILGARAIHLPLKDEQYATDGERTEVWESIRRQLEGVDALLLPGYPLVHPDHRWVTERALAQPPPDTALGFYIEQPYATWELVGGRRPRERTAARIAQLLRSDRVPRPRLAAETEALAGPVRWEVSGRGVRAQWSKLRAIRAYRSQLRGWSRSFLAQVMLFQWAQRGEPVAWVHPRPR